MIRSIGPFKAMERPVIAWTALGEPRSERYADCYFSAGQGRAESEHVFIAGNDLPERLREHGDEVFTIGELGFGSGLNFLTSWQTFVTNAPAHVRLHYWSVDRHPLCRHDLKTALSAFADLGKPAEQLLASYPAAVPGLHRRVFLNGRITLDLLWADADDALEDLSSLALPVVDCWYLDGFAPSRNESMWSRRVFQLLASASRDNASFATYSAAGRVRRDLQSAGFSVSKREGYGSKRESLQGRLQERPASADTILVPWDLPASEGSDRGDDVVVLGAGLAGAHVAAALARRGRSVQVFDAGVSAGLASGNAQAVLFTRLSHERSLLTDFSVTAFLYARDLYRQLFHARHLHAGIDGELNGCYQATARQAASPALQGALAGLGELARVMSAAEAELELGTAVAEAGLWQPESGWLVPRAVCAALLKTPGIRLRENCGPLRLECDAEGIWQVLDSSDHVIAAAPQAIICAGTYSGDFTHCGELPIKLVRGQTTQIPAPADRHLRRTYCHRGYISPAVQGEHCIGASYLPGDDGQDLRFEEHRHNVDALIDALPQWKAHLQSLDLTQLQGKAALRCVSPDYLPLAGRVPDRTAFMRLYAALGSDARAHITSHGEYVPGLYLSTAYGSRGLSYAALGGELVASQICRELPPVSRELQRALSPARFIIRGIIRGTL